VTYGRQSGRLVPCAVSPHHGHRPALEDCPYCDPIAAEDPCDYRLPRCVLCYALVDKGETICNNCFPQGVYP
jgi:hypothetical protein